MRSGESVNVAILFLSVCDINEARSTAATSSLATTVIEVFAPSLIKRSVSGYIPSNRRE